MAQNLVPLYIDKISGDIVASKSLVTNNGNSGNNPNANPGYEHTQLTPLTSWIISHNSNTKRLICQVYNEIDELIFADTVQITDFDTVTIQFGTAQSGAAKIVFF